MATAREGTLLCAIFLSLFAVCTASTSCYIGNSYYDVCEHGCCGTYPYEECCFNLTAVIAGVVVAVLVIVAIVVIVVCVVMHHKSNEVIRINQSAHSRRRDTANITILHLSSNNPYEHAPPPQPHMMTTTSYPNQPTTLHPPDVPFSGFHPNGPHPNPAPFLAPSAKAPPADPDPCFPPGGRPRLGGISGPTSSYSSGMMMMSGAPGMAMTSSSGEAPGMMPSSSSGPAMLPAMNGAPGMMPSSSSGPAMFPAMNGAPGMMPSSSSGPAMLPVMNGGPKLTSSYALPKITPRKLPLPEVPLPEPGSSSEPRAPPPLMTAFGGGKGKGGDMQREARGMGAAGGASATGYDNMGVEDMEEFY